MPPPWPILAEEALYGLAGDIVNTIDPFTEADKAAVLLNVLAAFGNCIHTTAHVKVQHDEHPTRLFIVLVGDTSKGRKGTGWSTPHIRVAFLSQGAREEVSPAWNEGIELRKGNFWLHHVLFCRLFFKLSGDVEVLTHAGCSFGGAYKA